MSEPVSLDDIDRSILRLLQQDATLSIAAVASEIGLSQTPCWRRIRRLNESGLITGRVTLLDPSLAGFGLTVFALISFKVVDEATMNAFEEAVQSIDQIVECYSVTGPRDFLMRIVAEDVAEYEQLLKKEIIHLPGVASVDTILTLSRVKFSTMIPV